MSLIAFNKNVVRDLSFNMVRGGEPNWKCGRGGWVRKGGLWKTLRWGSISEKNHDQSSRMILGGGPWKLPSRHFWDRRGWKSGLSFVFWDCGRWKYGPCLLGIWMVEGVAPKNVPHIRIQILGPWRGYFNTRHLPIFSSDMRHLGQNLLDTDIKFFSYSPSRHSKCPGLTCGINIVKPRFLFKTMDLWSCIMPIDRYSHTF